MALWQHEAVCLAVHRLGAQSSSHKEDITITELGEAVWKLEQANFDAGVLLGCDAFSAAAVMVSTRLPFRFGKNRVSLAELNLIFVLKVMELPPDELVIVGIL